jgi:hypothetical protein
MPGAIRDRGLLRALGTPLLEPRFGARVHGGGERRIGEGTSPLPLPLPGPPLPGPVVGDLPDDLSMLSSSDRTLRKLLFTIPSTVLGAEGDTDPVRLQLEAVYRAVFAALPETCEIVVLVKPDFEARATSWLVASNVATTRFEVRPMLRANATMWANDPFWTCAARTRPLDPPVLVEPQKFSRAGDRFVADDVKQHFGYAQLVLPRPFEGGNILVGDDFYLVGIDTVADLGPGVLTVSKAYRAMESQRRPIVVGGDNEPLATARWHETLTAGTTWSVAGAVVPDGSRQPIFHIDMFVTLVGRPDPASKFVVMVGDPSLATAKIGGPTWPVLGKDPTRQAEFDAVAMQLADDGFEVIRVPLPLVYDDDRSTGARQYYFASYNNAIVQRDPDRVLLPTYGDDTWPELRDIDDEVAQLWRDRGFEVVRLPDMSAFAIAGGAANCIKNVLARGFDPMP